MRFYALAQGRVQGVGFRYLVSHLARLHALTGWVRNCEDGSVEMEVQGERECAEIFFQAVRQGGQFARVDGLSVQPLQDEAAHESSFEILD